MDPFKPRKEKKAIDPILQKKVRRQSAPKDAIQKPEYVPSEKLLSINKMMEEQDDEKQTFDKFLSMYNDDNEKTKKKKKKMTVSESQLLRVRTKPVETGNFTQFEDFGKNEQTTDFYLTHFNSLDLKSFIGESLDVLERKIKEKADPKKVQSLISSAIDYKFESNDQKKPVAKEEDVLNNNVKIKNYRLKNHLKDANVVYSDKDNYILLMNQGYEQSYKRDQMPSLAAVKAEIAPARKHYPDEIAESEEKWYSRIKSYRDLVFCDPNEESCVSFRKLYLNQIANHFNKIHEIRRKNKEIDDEIQNGNAATQPEKVKVEGYTKPRVLIITPNKGDCYEIVRSMKLLLVHKSLRKKGKRSTRFIEEFGDEEKELDDEFKLGLTYEKDSLKFYASFDEADIIVASPLGLRLVIGAEGDEDRKFAFLSSIEICILDRCHVFQMQNWEHIEEIMSVMNRIPRHRDVVNDITEIREYYFENLARFFRQTIVYTEYRFPQLNSLLRNHVENHNGIVMNKPVYKRLNANSELPVNEEFLRFEVESHKEEPQARFDLFFKKMWEKLRADETLEKVVIFVSSYFEFVRLRNQFKKMNSNVLSISEYTNKSKIQSRVTRFNKGHFKFMLVTERAQFFGVCKARRFLNIFFYSLPQNALLYKELLVASSPVQAWRGGDQSKETKLALTKMMVKSLFCKFDAMAVERIVGTEKVREFMEDYNKNSTFVL